MTEQTHNELITMIKRLASLLHQNIDVLLRPYDLARTQYVVLYHLHLDPDITTGDLAERMQVEPATLTGITNTLESKGLIERVEYAGDKRRRDIKLTLKGRDLFDMIPPPGPVIEHMLVQGISPQNVDSLKDSGYAMILNLQSELDNNGGKKSV